MPDTIPAQHVTSIVVLSPGRYERTAHLPAQTGRDGLRTRCGRTINIDWTVTFDGPLGPLRSDQARGLCPDCRGRLDEI
jgi:hypothetical protein